MIARQPEQGKCDRVFEALPAQEGPTERECDGDVLIAQRVGEIFPEALSQLQLNANESMPFQHETEDAMDAKAAPFTAEGMSASSKMICMPVQVELALDSGNR
jgi:hypothetical protein